MTTEETTCPNCGNTYTLQFCNACGQKTPHRYTVGHVFHELFHVFTHTDKGVFPLAKNLLTRPGFLAKDLIEGRRKRHFNLFQYLIIALGITTFMVVKFQLMEQSMAAVNQGTGTVITEKMAEFQRNLAAGLQKYYNLFMFLLLPINAFVSWLLLRKKGLNYAEHIVFHSVVAAASTTISLFTIPLATLLPQGSMGLYMSFSLIILVVLYALSYHQLFGFKWIKAIGIAIGFYLITYIAQVLLFGIVATVYLIITLKQG